MSETEAEKMVLQHEHNLQAFIYSLRYGSPEAQGTILDESRAALIAALARPHPPAAPAAPHQHCFPIGKDNKVTGPCDCGTEYAALFPKDAGDLRDAWMAGCLWGREQAFCDQHTCPPDDEDVEAAFAKYYDNPPNAGGSGKEGDHGK